MVLCYSKRHPVFEFLDLKNPLIDISVNDKLVSVTRLEFETRTNKYKNNGLFLDLVFNYKIPDSLQQLWLLHVTLGFVGF
ncbi:hypothetical protein GCM10027170_29530 [Aliiglaciecola aliphaticivorans]